MSEIHSYETIFLIYIVVCQFYEISFYFFFFFLKSYMVVDKSYELKKEEKSYTVVTELYT